MAYISRNYSRISCPPFAPPESAVGPSPLKAAKVSIGLINPKSPANVGAVMRAAGCYRVDAVFYTGDRFVRAARFHTDTQNASQSIPLARTTDLVNCIAQGTSIVCVEFVEGALALPTFEHPHHAFYVFGPEDGTIDQYVLDRADAVVYVPTIGCMNLAASVNVVLYDRLAKTLPLIANNDLILRSRDTNNRAKLKRE